MSKRQTIDAFFKKKKILVTNNMIVYIEKEIAGNFTVKMIMDELYSMQNRRQAWFDVNILFCCLH